MAHGRREEGYDLDWGESVLFGDYDIRLDRSPDQILDEFEEQRDYEFHNVDLEFLLSDTQNFVVDTVEHGNSVAEELGISRDKLEYLRVEAQKENGTVLMSNVWEGSWRGRRIGTCLERAMTAHALYKELGLSSKVHVGRLLLDEGFEQHAWTSVEEEYLSDPSLVSDGVVSINEAERYEDSFFYTR